MKYLILTLILLLPACSQEDGRFFAVQESCIKGVTYYVRGYQLAVAYNTNATLRLCEVTK